MVGNGMLLLLIFFPVVCGVLVLYIGHLNEKARDIFCVLAALIEFVLLTYTACFSGSSSLTLPLVMGEGLTFQVDGFRKVYLVIAGFMWLGALALSREYMQHHEHQSRYDCFMLMTLGATVGVFLSADLFTTFTFFEMMSFTSYVWVAQEETKPALRAADTYLAIAVIGGLVMLMGILMLYNLLGTLDYTQMKTAAAGLSAEELFIPGLLCLVGFGAKAGAFPLHVWLPKAHPEAPAPASALLSGILTKTGIFGILLLTVTFFASYVSWGLLILCIGVITMFLGALLAVFSINLKRTLACSSMSQIGFILVGVGMFSLLGEEQALAFRGVSLHMINHSLIKLVLFLSAGAIYMKAHTLDLNALKGYGRGKPVLMIVFLIGAWAIAGLPLGAGYISKTLLHESIKAYGGGIFFTLVEWIFMFSGGMTLGYMTKLFVAIFIEKNEDAALQETYDQIRPSMSWLSRLTLVICAMVLLIWGLLAHQLMDTVSLSMLTLTGEAFEFEKIAYFSWENLQGAAFTLLFGAIVYLFIRKMLMKKGRYVNAWAEWLDLENLVYRPLVLRFLPFVGTFIFRIPDTLVDTVTIVLRKTLYRESPLPHERPEGNALTAGVGHVMNFVSAIIRYLRHGKASSERNYVHVAAIRLDLMLENYKLIKRSLSFGLLLFCAGLAAMLVYMVLF